MRRKGFILLAIFFGSLTTGSLYLYLHRLSETHIVALRPLVVSQGSLQAFQTLTLANISTVQVPVQDYPVGGLSDPKAVVGETARITIPAGEPLLQSMLAPVKLAPGMRAVAVSANLVNSVAYTLTPGDKVDVLATLNNTLSMVAQNVSIIDQVDDANHRPQAYILALNVQQALIVTLAGQKGQVQLIQRDLKDTQSVNTSPINLKGGLWP